ncbi:MAG: PfkB family carbohydrate kinase [Methylacidiphilales bacterium]|nr:PfkB family carbohydrate kinase [Candidatus Methylacidiphilales bacterium]
MNASFDVITTGLVIVDVLVRLPGEVHRGEKHEVADLLVTGGAPAGNAACVLGSLGWKTGYVARLGDDTISRIARAELTRCGVSDQLIISDPEASAGVAVVEIDPASGERTVFYNLSRYHFLRKDDIPPEKIKSARLVLADGYETEAALAMLEIARAAGVPSVLDLEAGDPSVLRRLLELGTHAILPLAAACRLTDKKEPGDALRALASWTKAQLAVTDGPRGAWALDGGNVIHQPIFPVKTVDTTGCGDAFHGAYASALLDGWALPLRLEFAAFIASRVAAKMGGRTELPTRESLRHENLSALSPELRSKLST